MTSLRFTEWSMGEGVLYNLVLTEWRHCVSENSTSDVGSPPPPSHTHTHTPMTSEVTGVCFVPRSTCSYQNNILTYTKVGGGPRVVVSTAAFHARVRGSVPGLGGLKETKKMFLPHPRVKVSIVGSLRDREVACSASDRQGSNFESCVWSTVSSQSSHHPQEVLLAQFILYVHI